MKKQKLSVPATVLMTITGTLGSISLMGLIYFIVISL